MKRKFLLSATAASVLSLLAASSSFAASVMVAGWDFSQYAFDGFLSVNGSNLDGGDTLGANYSDRDLTAGAGPDSAVYGTMYLNGLFGSTDTPLDFTDWFVPSSAAGGSLTSNGSPGVTDFDSFTTLTSEGQPFTNPLAMTALAAATVVFEADLSTDSATGSGWTVTFAAKTSTGTASVQVQVSLDGITFSNAGSASLTTTDTAFSFSVGAGPSAKAYARLVFSNPASGQNTFLDNVSFTAADVTVPEPSTAALLGLGLLGLARMGRRRA